MRGKKYIGKLCDLHPLLLGLRFKSSSICVTCATERQRTWREANPERNRHNALNRKYGLSLDRFNALLVAQGNCCAICRGTKPSGSGDWSVDHDHTRGAVRGILCSHCNTGLGHFRDDPLRLELAATYLRNYTA